LKNNIPLFFLLILLTLNYIQAAPYPLGEMTCDDIGLFASKAMQWREENISKRKALQKIEAMNIGEIENKNLIMVLNLIYSSYGNSWTIESAGNVLKADCKKGR